MKENYSYQEYPEDNEDEKAPATFYIMEYPYNGGSDFNRSNGKNKGKGFSLKEVSIELERLRAVERERRKLSHDE